VTGKNVVIFFFLCIFRGKSAKKQSVHSSPQLIFRDHLLFSFLAGCEEMRLMCTVKPIINVSHMTKKSQLLFGCLWKPVCCSSRLVSSLVHGMSVSLCVCISCFSIFYTFFASTNFTLCCHRNCFFMTRTLEVVVVVMETYSITVQQL